MGGWASVNFYPWILLLTIIDYGTEALELKSLKVPYSTFKRFFFFF